MLKENVIFVGTLRNSVSSEQMAVHAELKSGFLNHSQHSVSPLFSVKMSSILLWLKLLLISTCTCQCYMPWNWCLV